MAETKKEKPVEPEKTAPAAEARPRKWSARLPWALVVLLLLALIVVAGLPALVESQVNRLLDGIARQGRLSLFVKRITLFHTDLAVSAGPSAGVENVALEYSPWGLLIRRHVERIAVRGVMLPVECDGRTVKSPLLDMFPTRKDPVPTAPKVEKPAFRMNTLPVTVGQIELAGLVSLRLAVPDVPEETVLLPFEAELTAEKTHWEKVRYRFAADAPGVSLDCRGSFAGATHRIAGDLRLALDTRSLPRALRAGRLETGHAAPELNASFDVDLSPVKIHRLAGKMTLPVRAALPGGVAVDGNPEIRFALDPEAVGAEWTVLPVSVAGRTVKLGSGKFRWSPGKSAGEGEFRVSVGKTAGRIPVVVRRTPEKAWEVALSTVPDGPNAGFPAGEAKFVLDNGKFRLDGAWKGFCYAMPAGTLAADACRITAGGAFTDCRADIRLEKVSMTAPGGKWSAALPQIGLAANWRDKRLTGHLEFAGGTAKVAAAQAVISDIALGMPLEYPFPETLKGEFRIGGIAVRGKALGQLRADLQFRPWELTVAGSGDVGGLKPELAAVGAWTSAGLRFSGGLKLPEQPFVGDQLTAPWADKIGDLQVGGTVTLDSAFAWENGRFAGNCALQLKNGKVTSEERKIAVEGLTVRFALPYLPVLRSDGGQSVRCDSVRFGNIQTGPVRMMLRMDAPDAWCLERLTLNWCGGQIRSEFFRFNPQAKRIMLSVHCDRLNPVAMLVQLGAGQGTGNGDARISGSMQVSLDRDGGGIRVRDSFLYSTPGESGHVELAFSEAVKQAQSAGAVFDMTQAALRDFNYSWAKVRMTTEKDLLKISMQLNGSPAKPLYFTYGKDGIVKTDVPHKFQGILLDLNISLPLNDILDLVKKF